MDLRVVRVLDDFRDDKASAGVEAEPQEQSSLGTLEEAAGARGGKQEPSTMPIVLSQRQ